MTIPSLNRRALLHSGAVATGTLAASGLFSSPARAMSGTAPNTALDGMFAAWVLVYPERKAEIRLAHLDPQGAVAGQAPLLRLGPAELTDHGRRASAWGQMRQASLRAQALAVDAAAYCWSVPAKTCAVQSHRIVHPASGRSIGYAAWIDFA